MSMGLMGVISLRLTRKERYDFRDVMHQPLVLICSTALVKTAVFLVTVI